MTDDYLNKLWLEASPDDEPNPIHFRQKQIRMFAKFVERDTRHAYCDAINEKASRIEAHELYPAFGLNSQVEALKEAVKVAMNVQVVKDV